VPSWLFRKTISGNHQSEIMESKQHFFRIGDAETGVEATGASLTIFPIAARVRRDYFASAAHFKVASQRSCPRCMSVSSLLRRPAASFPTPASSITAWHMVP
jgi:hypothetical protein